MAKTWLPKDKTQLPSEGRKIGPLKRLNPPLANAQDTETGFAFQGCSVY